MSKKVAFIGTGPVSLMKGYLIAEKNADWEITFFDARDEVGGAWYSELSPQGVEIECGCHIWSYVPEVYRYIEKDLGVALVPYKPNAVFVGNTFKLPYSVKNSIDTYKYFFKNLLLFRFKNIKSMKGNPYMQFKLFGKKNLYPKTGSPELFAALKKKIDAQPNIKIINTKMVESVQAIEDGVIFNQDESLKFDEVFMTSVSQVKSVSSGAKSITIDPKQIDYIHFLLGSDKPLKKKVSYWRLMNDPVVHRITDISYQTDNKEQLSLVGIKGDAFSKMNEEELVNHVLSVYRKYGLIDDHTIDLIKTHVYPTFYIDQQVRKDIDSVDDRINLLHSTDLIHGFYFLLKEEGKIT